MAEEGAPCDDDDGGDEHAGVAEALTYADFAKIMEDEDPDGIDNWAQVAYEEQKARDVKVLTWAEICKMKEEQAMEVAASWEGCDDEEAEAEAKAVQDYNEYWK